MNPRVRSLALLVFASLPLMAQVDHASLSGTVTDASSAVVQGARVETRPAETDFRRQTTTGTGGTYEIPGLPIQYMAKMIEDEQFYQIVDVSPERLALTAYSIDGAVADGFELRKNGTSSTYIDHSSAERVQALMYAPSAGGGGYTRATTSLERSDFR